MCYRDLMDSLRRRGVDVSSSRIRWAINSGKVSRPPLDGSLRFVFSTEHVDELVNYFRVINQSEEVEVLSAQN